MSNLIYQKSYQYYIVYETRCTANGKTYIGAHATDDLNDSYLGSGVLLKEAIKKYGISSFSRKILFVFDNPQNMFSKEEELVTEDFVMSESTYNLVPGGAGGFKIQNVNVWKEKLRESSAKRQDKSPFKGPHSNETKQKISKSLKGRTPWNKGKPGTWIGKNHTEESKRRISENRKGLTAGEKNPMYGKSAVAGRKWYNDGSKTYYLFPDDPATETLSLGRLLKSSA